MRTGATLAELTVVLAVLALAAGGLLPAARRQADRAAVRGAREALAGMVARTRAEAILRGGAELRLDARGGRVEVVAADSVITELALGAEFRVALELGVDVERAVVAFDALGLGRVASRTVTFRRGAEQASLVISAYGRAVRR